MRAAALTASGGADRLLASDLARRVREASPLIASVVLSAERDGVVAHMRLDPLLIDARAGQQGLPDRSVAPGCRRARRPAEVPYAKRWRSHGAGVSRCSCATATAGS